ncbi:TlpA family protein disulfide reductase [Dokdonia sp. Asnod2-E02]|uniref:TlpA family protein disulfide reductase n=1 Tax=Dokdonia sp. Asnod2-E02 TaxID=3160574 RepID=UPI0038648F97
MKYHIALLSLLVVCTSSCISEDKDKADGTYIGGEIINPVQSYVLLRKGENVTDSIPLDRRNRFLHKLENFESGLYRFEHGEHQIVHIEEGDSILLRVNTKEFDESLSFSGYGSEKSTFLIDMYLHWESENNNIKRKYQKNPQNFQKTLDSMSIIHQEELSDFLNNPEATYSDDFIDIARAVSKLDNYQRKELYPFAHYGKDKLNFIKKLPGDFYRFRESVDINNPNLDELYGFRRYLGSYINHLSFLRYGDQSKYDRMSYVHNHHQIAVIDSIITNEPLKERLLNQMARIFIANSNNSKEVATLFDEIKAVSSSQETIENIDALYSNNESMQAGNTIPDVLIVDTNLAMSTLSSRITKPTVLYFWSYSRKSHMNNSHQKAKDLQRKYPEFNFIAINVNKEQDKWIRHLDNKNYNSLMEYQLAKPALGRKQLVLNDINKTIVLDKKGVILNSHANIHSSKFENELLAYLNQ